MGTLPRQLIELAENAGATVSRRDLAALAYTPRQIRGWIESGLLERVARGEYRIAGSSTTPHQDIASAVWRAGAGALAGGPLACFLHGLKGFPQAGLDHIVVPGNRRVRGVEQRIVRTAIEDDDRDRVHAVPTLAVVRALITATPSVAPSRIRIAHDDALRRKLIKRGEFADRAGALGNTFGAAAARRLAANGTLDSESEPERDLFSIFRPRDPKPERQVWVTTRGRWYRLDFAYRVGRIDIEYDGEAHAWSRHEDAERDFALAELDILTIRVTSASMKDPDSIRHRLLGIYDRRAAADLPPLPLTAPPWG